MLDVAGHIEAVAQEHPLRTSARTVPSRQGQTIAEIVAAADLDPRYGIPTVQLVRADRIDVIPADLWSKVRPKAGTRVEIGYAVEGPLAAIGAALISAAAPAIASASWGLGLTGFAATAATAAISIVGGLLVNALIPPPPQPRQQESRENRYSITGFSNAENRHGIYPKPLGRHRMFPPKSARGYSETKGTDIYYRGRVAFGWGPMSLEDIRIGTTPITAFDDIQIEFLNVDDVRTLAANPGLSEIATLRWKTAGMRMTLYPSDVAEDPFNVLLEDEVDVRRFTRTDTESVGIDVTFQRGLFRVSEKGTVSARKAIFRIRYRVPGGAWTEEPKWTCDAESREPIRFTYDLTFPEPGEYEVEIRRTNDFYDENGSQDHGYLTALRSFRPGNIPSYPGIAEMAFRVRASEQLSGQIDNLNAIVQQLAPVWDGSEWSDPVPVRHPAWIYADAIRGPHLRRPVPDSRIDLAALRAWADEESHWTCDYVVDTETRLADVLDIICASGRAKRALTDLRYSVIRDGAQGPVRQVFTPRNSWGFKGRMEFPREIHALRCMVTSERLEWERDEVLVYADGYSAANASEFETLELPGVVVTADDEDEGNVWRLGRYHLAQAIHRPEQYEWNADWEHMRVTRGDLVRIVHDVPVVGIGAARVQEISGGTITLDEAFDTDADDFRLTFRTQDGELVSVTATSPDEPFTRAWTTAGDLTGVEPGDLVAVEETAQESLDVLVTGIYPGENDTARLTGVPAAPVVLQADQGVIPPYDPIITNPRNPAERGPEPPVVERVISDERSMLTERGGNVSPRIAVMVQATVSQNAPAYYQLRWRKVDSPLWSHSAFAMAGVQVIYTDALAEYRVYEVQIRSVDELGSWRGWVDVGEIEARALTAVPPNVTNFGISVVGRTLRMGWSPTDRLDIAKAEIRHSPLPAATWNASSFVENAPWPATSATAYARPGTYLIKWMDRGGNYSANAATYYLTDDEIGATNAVATLEASPDWHGIHDGTAIDGGDLRLERVGDAYIPEGVWQTARAIDLGQAYAAQVTAYIEAVGASRLDTMANWTSLAAVNAIGSSNPTTWGVSLEVSTANENPTDPGAHLDQWGSLSAVNSLLNGVGDGLGVDGVWSEWQPLTAGDIRARFLRFRAVLSSSRQDVTPAISELAFVIDMPDRTAKGKGVSAEIGGSQIAYSPAFREPPALTITTKSLPTGARHEITNETREGFQIQFFDSGGVSIAATFDYLARGYGREIVTA